MPCIPLEIFFKLKINLPQNYWYWVKGIVINLRDNHKLICYSISYLYVILLLKTDCYVFVKEKEVKHFLMGFNNWSNPTEGYF